MDKIPTVIFFCYRLIDFRLLFNSKVFKNCSDRMSVVVVVPKSAYPYCKRILSKKIKLRILNHAIVKEGHYKADFKNKIENYFRNIFSLTYAKSKNFKDCMSQKPQIDAFLNTQKSKGPLKYLLANCIVQIALLISNLRLLRNFLSSILFLLLKNDAHRNIYSEFKPNLIVVGSMGLDVDAQVIYEARSNNIKTLVINQSWDRVVCKGYPIIHPDYLIVWNKHMKDESIFYLDMPSNSIFIEGAANWDYIFKKKKKIDKKTFFKSINLNPKLKTVYYPLSSAFWHEELINNLNQFLIARQKKELNKNLQIIFRVHPYYWITDKKHRNELFSVLGKLEKIKGFYIDYNKVIGTGNSYILTDKDQISLLNFYEHADVCVSVLSSSMLEMSFFGKPSFNFVFGVGKMRGHKIELKNYNLHHINHLKSFDMIKNITVFSDLLRELNDIDNNKIEKSFTRNFISSEAGVNLGEASIAYANRILKLSTI